MRTIDDDDLQAVTPDAAAEGPVRARRRRRRHRDQADRSDPARTQARVSASSKLLHQTRLGHVSEDLVSSLASRIARIDSRITTEDRDSSNRLPAFR